MGAERSPEPAEATVEVSCQRPRTQAHSPPSWIKLAAGKEPCAASMREPKL